MVNGEATALTPAGPGPAGRRQLWAACGHAQCSLWSRQGCTRQGASPPHPAPWSHDPALVLQGPPPLAARRLGSALPPGSELPGSPFRGGSSRASPRRGRAWMTVGLLHPEPASPPTATWGQPRTVRGSPLGEPPSKNLQTRSPGVSGMEHDMPAWTAGGTCYRSPRSPIRD